MYVYTRYLATPENHSETTSMASTGRQEQRGEKAFVPHASTRSPAQHKVNLAYKIHKSLSLFRIMECSWLSEALFCLVIFDDEIIDFD